MGIEQMGQADAKEFARQWSPEVYEASKPEEADRLIGEAAGLSLESENDEKARVQKIEELQKKLQSSI